MKRTILLYKHTDISENLGYFATWVFFSSQPFWIFLASGFQAVDDIYYDMDMDHHADISSDEMLSWSQRGNNIVDRLADIIDQEVYQIWLAESKKRATNMRRSYESPGSPQSSGYNQDGSMGSMNSRDGRPGMNGNGPNGNESPMSHSEYGPPPSYSTSPQGQDRSNGWFGGYFNGNPASPASRTQHFSSSCGWG